MSYYFLTSRSLTYAQRTGKILEKAGITSYLARTPKSIAREGCGHGVRVAETSLNRAIAILNKANLPPNKIYRTTETGFQEVIL